MTTITAVKRALEETSHLVDEIAQSMSCEIIAGNPTALTILANRLNDKGDAGNVARDQHLARLRSLKWGDTLSFGDIERIEWVIDQLTPPQVNTTPGVARLTEGMPVCDECGGWGEHTLSCGSR